MFIAGTCVGFGFVDSIGWTIAITVVDLIRRQLLERRIASVPHWTLHYYTGVSGVHRSSSGKDEDEEKETQQPE